MRYLKLLSIFYRNSLLAEMEYRANFVVNTFMSAFWAAFALLGLRVFFHHRQQLGGWEYHEAMLVVGVYTAFSGLIEALLQPNITRIVEHIREGTFDFVLIKPVNSQFMASLRQLSVWKLANVMVGACIGIYALIQLRVMPSLYDMAAAAGFLVNAALIVYSIWVMMAATAFWFVRIDNITELFNSIYETGRFPVTAYPGWLRGILTFVVPVAFVTTFPSSALLGRSRPAWFLISCLIAAGLFLCSALLWRFAVRHYSSASS